MYQRLDTRMVNLRPHVSWHHETSGTTIKAMASNLIASLLLVAMPGAPSSFLLLVVRPGAPTSVLVSNSVGLHPKLYLSGIL